MQQEGGAIPDDAAAEPSTPVRVDPIALTTVTTAGDGSWSREEIYGDGGR